MRGASQPSEAVHSTESMWSEGELGFCGILRKEGRGIGLPVKVRPKMSSSGGIKGFGEEVLKIESLDGSMDGSFAMASCSDWML